MPKGIDPKAYAARITRAKKIVNAMDPATKAKLKEMYPPLKKEQIVNKALSPKKSVAKKPTTPKAPSKGAKVPMPKTTPKSPGRRQPMPPDYDVIIPGMGYTKPGKNQPPKKIKKK